MKPEEREKLIRNTISSLYFNGYITEVGAREYTIRLDGYGYETPKYVSENIPDMVVLSGVTYSLSPEQKKEIVNNRIEQNDIICLAMVEKIKEKYETLFYSRLLESTYAQRGE